MEVMRSRGNKDRHHHITKINQNSLQFQNRLNTNNSIFILAPPYSPRLKSNLYYGHTEQLSHTKNLSLPKI